MERFIPMEEITIRDVAQICGVGVSTVSRAINNHPDISPETRQMVMQVIKEHNYIPNNSARNLKRQTAKAIAVLVKGIDNSFFHEMIRDIEEEIKKRKYTMVLRHVKSSEDEVNVALQLVKEKRLKGIIFLGGCFVHNEEKLSQLQVPFVLSTAGAVALDEKKVKYCSVSVDDEKESYRLVNYLIQAGHRDIAIICEKAERASISTLRLEGYKRALKEHQIPIRQDRKSRITPWKMGMQSQKNLSGKRSRARRCMRFLILWRSGHRKHWWMQASAFRKIFPWWDLTE